MFITELFKIQYPIVQAGMAWCSGWELASAVSNAGGLGLIGAGSMQPEVLQLHIDKTKANTDKPFGVNVPLLYSRIDETMKVIINSGIKIVFTSAGNPSTWTSILKNEGIIVVHVVSNLKFAQKAEAAGVDAIVAEGVEAGGHNGREETSTLTLLPLIIKNTHIPVIAAGGIGCGKSMLAVMSLGAAGVQIGSRFVASTECSAHQNFKNTVIQLPDGGTRLSMKKITPVRLIKNSFCNTIESMEEKGVSKEELLQYAGKGRTRLGMFEGNMEEGELEIGQVAANFDTIMPASDIIKEIMLSFHEASNKVKDTFCNKW